MNRAIVFVNHGIHLGMAIYAGKTCVHRTGEVLTKLSIIGLPGPLYREFADSGDPKTPFRSIFNIYLPTPQQHT